MLQTIAVCCNKATVDYTIPPDKALTDEQKDKIGSTEVVRQKEMEM